VHDVHKKLRNTLKFALGNIYDFDANLLVPFEKLEPVILL